MRTQRGITLAVAGLLVLSACSGASEGDPDGAASVPDSASSSTAPDDGAGGATGAPVGPGGVPANDAEVVAAVAFGSPWVEQDPRPDGAKGWVADVENFPTDAGFEVPTDAQIADATARGLVSTRNRHFKIEGGDPESGTDDAYATIFAADFSSPAQADAAVEFAFQRAMERPDGAAEAYLGVEGTTIAVFDYSIAKCESDGQGGFNCPDEPPWSVTHVLLSVDRFAVMVSVAWPTGMPNDTSEALSIAEELLTGFPG